MRDAWSDSKLMRQCQLLDFEDLASKGKVLYESDLKRLV